MCGAGALARAFDSVGVWAKRCGLASWNMSELACAYYFSISSAIFGRTAFSERFKLPSDPFSGFEHFFVIDGLVQNAGRHVRHAGNGEDPDSHVGRDNALGYSRHAYHVGANRSQVANLGRSFVARAKQGRRRLLHRPKCPARAPRLA